MSEKEINGLKTEEKLKLVDICQKLIPLGAVELADDLEEIIDIYILNKHVEVKHVGKQKMISDKEIEKTLKECLDDPVHGKMFRKLFLNVIKLRISQEKARSQLYGKCESCDKDFPKKHLKFLKFRWICIFCLKKS